MCFDCDVLCDAVWLAMFVSCPGVCDCVFVDVFVCCLWLIVSCCMYCVCVCCVCVCVCID